MLWECAVKDSAKGASPACSGPHRRRRPHTSELESRFPFAFPSSGTALVSKRVGWLATFVQTGRMVDASAALTSHFDERAATYAKRGAWVSDPASLAPLAAVVVATHVKCAVEIGVGSGAVPAFLASRGHLPDTYVGLDLSTGMLMGADGWLPVRDAVSLPLRSSQTDVVVVRQAIHYFDAVERVLGEVQRVLRPGGRLVVAQITPFDNEADIEWWRRCVELRQPLRRHAWTQTELLDAMLSAGFAVETLPQVFGVSSLDSWLSRYPSEESVVRQMRTHYLEAPQEVRDLRRLTTSIDGDIEFRIRWSTLVGRLDD